MCKVLQPLDAELWTLGALDKVRPRPSLAPEPNCTCRGQRCWSSYSWQNGTGAFNGQLLLLHGLADELARGLNVKSHPGVLEECFEVPYEGSESLHAAAASRQKEVVLVKAS